MAEKQITLRLKAIQTDLDTALKKIERLEKIVNKLNNTKIKLNTSTAGTSIKTLRDKVDSVRKSFDEATKATDRQKAATALLAGNFKILSKEAAAFAMATKRTNTSKTLGNVGARLKEIEKFPKTMFAGKKAMEILNSMLEVTNVKSDDFLKINKAIGKQLEKNADIQKKATKQQGIEEEKRFQRVLKNIRKRKRLEKGVGGRGGRGGRRAQQLQGNMLGAGFPLLFGGGAGSVAGSLAGSMLAPPGMQFGAQILGSALGTILEQNLQKIQAIGNATKIINLDALKDSGIRVNAELEKTVNHLKLINEEQKAQELIMKEVARQTGTVEGTNEDIADLINLLGKEWGTFTARISSTLGMLSVPFIAALTGILSLVNLILKGVNYIISGIGWLLKKLVEFVLGETIVAGILRYVLKLDDAAQDLLKKMDDFHRDIEEQRMAIKERIALGEKEAAILEKIRKTATELGIDKNSKEYVDLDNAIRGLAVLEQQEESVKRLRDLYKSLGQTIEDGVVNAIQAAIDGTKTLGDVARSVFRELQRSLIRYSVNALSRSIFSFNPMANALGQETSTVKNILPLGAGNIYGVEAAEILNGLYGTDISPLNDSQLDQLQNILPYLKANGGSVKGGNDYIVGERGPELFSPGVSGMITPNHMLGGSTNVVVNVDASGSSVEGDDQRSRELGQMLSAAIQSELIKQRRPGGLLT